MFIAWDRAVSFIIRLMLTRAIPRLAILALLSCGCRDQGGESDSSSRELLHYEPVRVDKVLGQYEGMSERWDYVRLTLALGGTGSVLMVNPAMPITNSGALEWHVEDGVIAISAAVPGERRIEARPFCGETRGGVTEYLMLSIYGYDYVRRVGLMRSELLTSLRDVQSSQFDN